MKNYHAHVYFDLPHLHQAQKVLDSAKGSPHLMKVFWLVPKKVGPHIKPMFEIHFSEKNKEDVLSWLENHRDGLSVLIHEDTGDDIKDHTENVLWLGEPLDLDFSFFDLVKADPSKSLH